jgi:hypothetical protein
MKLGFLTAPFPETPLMEVADWAAASGFEVLEIACWPRASGPTRRYAGTSPVDVANLSGEESVGSLVSFIDGRPFKSGYRRFRIRSVAGVDDYAMIREVVGRRFRRLKEEGGPLPDVLLIDGGAGHLACVLAALEKAEVQVVLVLGLAKEQEEIHVPGRARPLRLERRSNALRLLQHVRDEAHRFAQHYHHLLRRKRTFGLDTGRPGKKTGTIRRRRKGQGRKAESG